MTPVEKANEIFDILSIKYNNSETSDLSKLLDHPSMSLIDNDGIFIIRVEKVESSKVEKEKKK